MDALPMLKDLATMYGFTVAIVVGGLAIATPIALLSAWVANHYGEHYGLLTTAIGVVLVVPPVIVVIDRFSK